MRKLVLRMSMSLDGFVCNPEGKIDWIFSSSDEQSRAWLLDRLWQVGVHAMGSRTFWDMAAFWPFSTEPFAAPMNEIPKAVFTRNKGFDPASCGPNTQAMRDAEAARAAAGNGSSVPSAAVTQSWKQPAVYSGDLAEELTRLKEQDGKPILAHGGASFVQSVAQTGLVDEYWLLVHPVALGQGRALFSELQRPLPLHLVSSTAFPGGVVAHVYTPRQA
jgi:dihydrofolate reductase